MCHIQCTIPLEPRYWRLAKILCGDQAGLFLGSLIDACINETLGSIRLQSGIVTSADEGYIYSGTSDKTITHSDRLHGELRTSLESLMQNVRKELSKLLSSKAQQQNGRLFVTHNSIKQHDLDLCINEGVEGLITFYRNMSQSLHSENTPSSDTWCVFVRCGSKEAIEYICSRVRHRPFPQKELQKKFLKRLKSAIQNKLISIEGAVALYHECIAESHSDTPEYRLQELTTWSWISNEYPHLAIGKDQDSELIVWMFKQESCFYRSRQPFMPGTDNWAIINSCVPKAFERANRLKELLLTELTVLSLREILELCDVERNIFSLKDEPARVRELASLLAENTGLTIVDIAKRINCLRDVPDRRRNKYISPAMTSESTYECPSCSSILYLSEDWQYCPYCYQAIDPDA